MGNPSSLRQGHCAHNDGFINSTCTAYTFTHCASTHTAPQEGPWAIDCLSMSHISPGNADWQAGNALRAHATVSFGSRVLQSIYTRLTSRLSGWKKIKGLKRVNTGLVSHDLWVENITSQISKKTVRQKWMLSSSFLLYSSISPRNTPNPRASHHVEMLYALCIIVLTLDKHIILG